MYKGRMYNRRELYIYIYISADLGACWMVSVTERVKTLFFSPLQPRNTAKAGEGGRGGIPCPLPSRPPPLRQPFQPSPTPSPACRQATFQNDEKVKILETRPQVSCTLDFLCAVSAKNIVPVIVSSEDSASRKGGVGAVSRAFPPGPTSAAAISAVSHRFVPAARQLSRTGGPNPKLLLGPKPLGARTQACPSKLSANLLLAPLDLLRAVPPKNIVPVIVLRTLLQVLPFVHLQKPCGFGPCLGCSDGLDCAGSGSGGLRRSIRDLGRAPRSGWRCRSARRSASFIHEAQTRVPPVPA